MPGPGVLDVDRSGLGGYLHVSRDRRCYTHAIGRTPRVAFVLVGSEQEPLLATITAASIQGQVATGERAGQPVRRRLLDPQEGIRTGPLCFASRGFSLHAATRVPAADRTRLEGLCRYVNRPPLAAGRLQILDAEQVAFDLKTPWSDGTYRIELSPQELIEKLAALVPPRRLNLVRYHGVLAPNAADRAQKSYRGPKKRCRTPTRSLVEVLNRHPPNAVIAWPGRPYWHAFFAWT